MENERSNGNKWKRRDQSDPPDWQSPAITLDSMIHGPSYWNVQNKWGFFSFQISWITRVTDPSVQTNSTLMRSYKTPHHVSFKTSIKLLTIFAKMPILYALLGSELTSDASISRI